MKQKTGNENIINILNNASAATGKDPIELVEIDDSGAVIVRTGLLEDDRDIFEPNTVFAQLWGALQASAIEEHKVRLERNQAEAKITQLEQTLELADSTIRDLEEAAGAQTLKVEQLEADLKAFLESPIPVEGTIVSELRATIKGLESELERYRNKPSTPVHKKQDSKGIYKQPVFVESWQLMYWVRKSRMDNREVHRVVSRDAGILLGRPMSSAYIKNSRRVKLISAKLLLLVLADGSREHGGGVRIASRDNSALDYQIVSNCLSGIPTLAKNTLTEKSNWASLMDLAGQVTLPYAAQTSVSVMTGDTGILRMADFELAPRPYIPDEEGFEDVDPGLLASVLPFLPFAFKDIQNAPLPPAPSLWAITKTPINGVTVPNSQMKLKVVDPQTEAMTEAVVHQIRPGIFPIHRLSNLNKGEFPKHQVGKLHKLDLVLRGGCLEGDTLEDFHSIPRDRLIWGQLPIRVMNGRQLFERGRFQLAHKSMFATEERKANGLR